MKSLPDSLSNAGMMIMYLMMTLNWRICLANLSAGQTNAELWNREGMLDNLQKQDNVNKINQKTQAGEGRLAFFDFHI